MFGAGAKTEASQQTATLANMTESGYSQNKHRKIQSLDQFLIILFLFFRGGKVTLSCIPPWGILGLSSIRLLWQNIRPKIRETRTGRGGDMGLGANSGVCITDEPALRPTQPPRQPPNLCALFLQFSCTAP